MGYLSMKENMDTAIIRLSFAVKFLQEPVFFIQNKPFFPSSFEFWNSKFPHKERKSNGLQDFLKCLYPITVLLWYKNKFRYFAGEKIRILLPPAHLTVWSRSQPASHW